MKTDTIWALAFGIMFVAWAINTFSYKDDWFVDWCVDTQHGQYGKDENGVGTCYEYAEAPRLPASNSSQ